MKRLIKTLPIIILPISLIIVSCTGGVDIKSMKKTLDQYVSYWNTGNLDGAESTLAEDYELVQSPDYVPQRGIVKLKKYISNLRLSYPDFKLTIDEVVYDRNRIAVLWTITGSNTGPGDIPATGRSVNGKAISIIHFLDGKIKDDWLANNNLLWLMQLGYKLTPPEVPAGPAK